METKTAVREHGKALRAASRERRLADMRDGRFERSNRMPNKRREQSRKACRKGGIDA